MFDNKNKLLVIKKITLKIIMGEEREGRRGPSRLG